MTKRERPALINGVPAATYASSQLVVLQEEARRYGDRCFVAGKATKGPPHNLYRTGDPDAPRQICDSNGEVVLALCKTCGMAEVELQGSPVCLGVAHPEALTEFGEGQWWVLELENATRNGTDEQKRAMAVVRHLLLAVKNDLSRRLSVGAQPIDFKEQQ